MALLRQRGGGLLATGPDAVRANAMREQQRLLGAARAPSVISAPRPILEENPLNSLGQGLGQFGDAFAQQALRKQERDAAAATAAFEREKFEARLSQAKAKQKRFRTLSRDETKNLGLPTGVVVQQDQDGRLYQLGAGGTKIEVNTGAVKPETSSYSNQHGDAGNGKAWVRNPKTGEVVTRPDGSPVSRKTEMAKVSIPDARKITDSTNTLKSLTGLKTALGLDDDNMSLGDRGRILAGRLRVPFTEGRGLYQRIERAVEVLLRQRTGAAAPDAEVEKYTQMFAPSTLDSAREASAKLDALSDAFRGVIDIVKTQKPAALERYFKDLNENLFGESGAKRDVTVSGKPLMETLPNASIQDLEALADQVESMSPAEQDAYEKRLQELEAEDG